MEVAHFARALGDQILRSVPGPDGDLVAVGVGGRRRVDKVKRLRRCDLVEVTPCTVRGKPTGPAVGARARRLSGAEAEAANRLLVRKHRFVHRAVVPLEVRIKRTQNVLYELTLRADTAPAARPAASAG